MLESGTEQCPCARKKCERYGKCEECIERHKTHKKYPLPYCQRKAVLKEERTTRIAEPSRTSERVAQRER